MAENYFSQLSAISLNNKTKEKNGLTYADWASVWSELKAVHPDANYNIHRREDMRPWFDDGRTGWVTVTVTIPSKDIYHTVDLPIMDFKNKSIPADNITSMDANKAWQRCLVKACAMHGLGLYIYAKLTDSEENLEIKKLQDECMKLIIDKSKLSDTAKAKVAEVCKEADADANGDPRLIEDIDTLEALRKKLLAIRK